jgi:hypothetical protein
MMVRWVLVCALLLACASSQEKVAGSGGSGGAGNGGSGGAGAGDGGAAAGGAAVCPPAGSRPTGPCRLPSGRTCNAGFVDCCMPITHGYPLVYECANEEWTVVHSVSCGACPASGGRAGNGGAAGSGGLAGEGGDGGTTSQGGEGGEGLVPSAGAAGEGGAP